MNSACQTFGVVWRCLAFTTRSKFSLLVCFTRTSSPRSWRCVHACSGTWSASIKTSPLILSRKVHGCIVVEWTESVASVKSKMCPSRSEAWIRAVRCASSVMSFDARATFLAPSRRRACSRRVSIGTAVSLIKCSLRPSRPSSVMRATVGTLNLREAVPSAFRHSQGTYYAPARADRRSCNCQTISLAAIRSRALRVHRVKAHRAVEQPESPATAK